MEQALLQKFDLPLNADTLCCAKHLIRRNMENNSGELALHCCTIGDLEKLQELIQSIGWQVANEDIAVILEHGELWALSCNGQFISSAGWLSHGGNSAWIVLVTTRPEWRGCSAATLMMYKVLETSSHFAKRLLDASNMGESVYCRIGFKECAQVHFYEFESDNSALSSPQYCWQNMREEHFALPGTFPDAPAIKILFERNPELCYVLLEDDRIVGWFTGREKSSHIHIGPIYAENSAVAFDAVCFMRQMHPRRKLTVDVFADETELVNALQNAKGAFHHSHTRMYYAGEYVERALKNVRSSSGPDFG